jgi:NAD(P)-dependent dehydrogenase (short-subunit alcohol dehydrogenase family)
MSDHVQDRVIIVTGAGSGFGRLVAEMTAARGAKVVAASTSPTNFAHAASQCVRSSAM